MQQSNEQKEEKMNSFFELCSNKEITLHMKVTLSQLPASQQQFDPVPFT